MRGAYMNWGSKDVGADPDWDVTTRRYKEGGGKSGGAGAPPRFNPSPEDIAEARESLKKTLKARGLLAGDEKAAEGK